MAECVQGVVFDHIHVKISDSYKEMYDAAAALWLEVKEAIDTCKESGLIEGPLKKASVHVLHDNTFCMSMLPLCGYSMHGCTCNQTHQIRKRAHLLVLQRQQAVSIFCCHQPEPHKGTGLPHCIREDVHTASCVQAVI